MVTIFFLYLQKDQEGISSTLSFYKQRKSSKEITETKKEKEERT